MRVLFLGIPLQGAVTNSEPFAMVPKELLPVPCLGFAVSAQVPRHGLCQWSDYRKSLPGQFIRIRLKIEQNRRLFLDIFISAIMNDLFMTFTSRLKVDAKCVYRQ